MYFYIKGRLVIREEDYIVVDNGDIGYHIICPLGISSNLGDLGSYVTVYTYQNVREDDISLFGFSSREEKEIFLQLITVSGVGPKVAQAICSQIEPDRLAFAVINGDTTALTKVKGLGKKTSERIVLELSDKLKKKLGRMPNIRVSKSVMESSPDSDVVNDAINALIVLGYREEDAYESVCSCYAEECDLQQLIKNSLKMMMKN